MWQTTSTSNALVYEAIKNKTKSKQTKKQTNKQTNKTKHTNLTSTAIVRTANNFSGVMQS